ncbi:MAG: hypothetical protein KDI71_16055, partial [Xanthomonadales bacterium]|nr:hypothetical protein [Xanthomonadales bacterium]
MQLATVFRLILASAWLTLGVAHAQGSADYQFQTRAALPLGLGGHAATVLDSGMVLVVGGQAQSSAYQSACYLYDPALDLWTATGALAEARRGVKLAHLNGGGVLAVGGSIGDSSASVERYNPTDGQWQVVESMGVARDSHAVVTLIDGSVLAIGGRELVSGTGTVLSSVKRFDPGTGLWSAATPMIYTRMNHTATLLDNGEVLVAGGYGGSAVGALSSAEIYNPRTGVWRPAADLPETRLNHIDLPLNSGEVMLVGGNAAPFGAGVNIGLIYDSVADSWRSSAPSVFARRNTSAVRL